jgi:hypothetical protein
VYPFGYKSSFYGVDLLAPCLASILEDHPLSALRRYLFTVFAATLHIGCRTSISNLKTRHVVLKGTEVLEKLFKNINCLVDLGVN